MSAVPREEVATFGPDEACGKGRHPGGEQAVEAVHDRLRDAILRGEIPPDVPLSQVRLAQQLGVSRTPLREALRMLQREGLVEGEPHRRLRVCGFSVPDLEQLYAMRIALEALAIRLTVPRLTGANLTHIEKHLVETEHCALVEDYDRWSVPHRAFHAGLVAHAGERVLATVAQLADHAERYRRVYKLETPGAWIAGSRGHREIFDACVAGDEVAAADQLARHYARVALSVIALIAPEHEPAVVRSALRMAARVEPIPTPRPAPSDGPARPPTRGARTTE